MTTFTRTWNAGYESSPPNSQDARLGATRIRELKVDTRERLEVDHSHAGTADDGKHKKVTLIEQGSNPTLDANNGALFTKDVGGITELFYIDSAGNVQQLTSAGGVVATPTGVMQDYWGSAAPAGWVLASGRTIGNASSGATERANADTVALFTLLWGALADAEAPVSGGRGASAAADYAANKTITLPDLRGRVAVGKDDMGGSAASRVTNAISGITATTLGKAGGSQSLQAHTHGVTDPGHAHAVTVAGASLAGTDGPPIASAVPVGSSTSSATTGISIQSTGAGSSQNMQPSIVVNKIIKL